MMVFVRDLTDRAAGDQCHPMFSHVHRPSCPANAMHILVAMYYKQLRGLKAVRFRADLRGTLLGWNQGSRCSREG